MSPHWARISCSTEGEQTKLTFLTASLFALFILLLREHGGQHDPFEVWPHCLSISNYSSHRERLHGENSPVAKKWALLQP